MLQSANASQENSANGKESRPNGLRSNRLDSLSHLHLRLGHRQAGDRERLLVERHRRGDAATRAALEAFYLDHLDGVDHWDLVDVSAPQLLGEAVAAGPSPSTRRWPVKFQIATSPRPVMAAAGAPVASMTRWAAPMTSGPMPSPGMHAIL